MNTKQLHQSNRAAWNEAARQYEQEVTQDIAFLRTGGQSFMEPERTFLADLNGWCRRAIHLQCAGGKETLSLWNAGAREVIGVDISDKMIACAQSKSAALNAPATWYCCDVLETPASLNDSADLVYTGRGSLNWIMDIDAWAQVVTRLLKPHGGRFYLFDGHPLDWVWDQEATEPKLDPDPAFGSYFSTSLNVSQGWHSDYIQDDLLPPLHQQARKYEHHWTLAQIITALAQAGLCLERLAEHPEQFTPQFSNWPSAVIERLPHTVSLLMRRL
ncbi:MAG: class I SAM-dependent methyltransferase [Caldilineaceae bacterium]